MVRFVIQLKSHSESNSASQLNPNQPGKSPASATDLMRASAEEIPAGTLRRYESSSINGWGLSE